MTRRKPVLFGVIMLLVAVLAGPTACTSSKELPLIEGKAVVAMVNGEPITQEEYEQEILSLHAPKLEGGESDAETAAGDDASQKKAGRIDYAGLLKRIIDARLIVQEAKTIGLAELPEYREAKASYSQGALQSLLRKQVLSDVKPDQNVVDGFYQQAIREWKLTSILFSKEEDAKRLAAKVRKGADFDELVKKAVSERKARGGTYDEYQPGNDILPPIYEALLSMGTGSVSPVIDLSGRYALVKVEDYRLMESQEKKDAATERALQQKKQEVWLEYVESLKKKYARTNSDIIERLDLDTSLEAFDQLKKDDRVITEIADSDRITVADLVSALEQKYFHSVKGQIEKRGLNANKNDMLERLIEKKVLLHEARAVGVDQANAYAVLMKTFETSRLFGLFLQKVVLPEIRIEEAEVQKYYDDHRSDFTSPERMQLDGIVFKQRADAEDAMRKLRAGDQYSWIKANAEGQVDPKTEGLLQLGGAVVVVPRLSEDLRNSLSGAKPGDFRLYESPDGYFYVLSIMAVDTPTVLDFATVKQPIARQIYKERTEAAFVDWVKKLRDAADVKTYMQYR